MKTKSVESTFAGGASLMDKRHHDLHIGNVTPERFNQAGEFVRACECVALWRLKMGRMSDDAGSHLFDLAAQIAEVIRKLCEAGDIGLARFLPSIVQTMQEAESFYGTKFTKPMRPRPSITDLLKKKRPIELIQMFAALHSDWAELCGIEDGPALLRKRESQLRELLLSEEEWRGFQNGKRVVEKRKHRLAQIIENIAGIREHQQHNFNLFVEHLWQGRLWCNGKLQEFAWPERPPRGDVKAWMKIIMPRLKKVTEGDPRKLTVFEYMLAGRQLVHDGMQIDEESGARLATASNKSDIWNQIRAEIRKAWARMAKQSKKPVFRKSA